MPTPIAARLHEPELSRTSDAKKRELAHVSFNVPSSLKQEELLDV
jgi:hypothetical protein